MTRTLPSRRLTGGVCRGTGPLIQASAARTRATDRMAERLVREQQALSALKGTSAVEVFDICRGSEGELCLVMELLSGIDLDESLYQMEQRSEQISLLRVAEIFDPIVDTLEVANESDAGRESE